MTRVTVKEILHIGTDMDPNSVNPDESVRVKVHTVCLKPMLVMMALAGCYGYNRHDNKDGKRSNLQKALLVYRIILILMCACIIAKSVTSFFCLKKLETQSPVLAIILLCWSLICLMNLLIALKTDSSKYGNQEKAFDLWNDEVIPEMKSLKVPFNVPRYLFKRTIVMMFGILITLMSAVWNIVLISGVYDDHIQKLFMLPLGTSLTEIILMIPFNCIISLSGSMPVFYLINVSILLTDTLATLNLSLQSEMMSRSGTLPADFQQLRKLHLKICSIVQHLDTDLCWNYGSYFVLNMSLCLVLMYSMLKHENKIEELILYSFWFVILFVYLGCISVFAAKVHEAAHAPLDTIYFINVQDADFEKLAQINLFLSKLTGTQVGFTACGLITITKEFILTIAGVFLTYFAVLYTL